MVRTILNFSIALSEDRGSDRTYMPGSDMYVHVYNRWVLVLGFQMPVATVVAG